MTFRVFTVPPDQLVELVPLVEAAMSEENGKSDVPGRIEGGVFVDRDAAVARLRCIRQDTSNTIVALTVDGLLRGYLIASVVAMPLRPGRLCCLHSFWISPGAEGFAGELLRGLLDWGDAQGSVEVQSYSMVPRIADLIERESSAAGMTAVGRVFAGRRRPRLPGLIVEADAPHAAPTLQ